MSKPLMNIVYVLIIAVGLVAMYSLLNAGNTNSLLRPVFPDPAKDLYVAVISSLIVFVLGFVVFFNRDSEGFRNLIEMNGERIHQLRNHFQQTINALLGQAVLPLLGITQGIGHHATPLSR